jgi:ArsR family metal-binding transcriptional regulator
MLKKIKNFFCKLFNIKACKCDDVDEHIEYFTKVPEPETKVHVEPCNIHRYFKKRCGYCQAFAKANP